MSKSLDGRLPMAAAVLAAVGLSAGCDAVSGIAARLSAGPGPILPPPAGLEATLQIRIALDGAADLARRVKATTAEVDRVTIRVTPASGSAQTATVPRTEFRNGSQAVTLFGNLAAGTASVGATALDIAGGAVGSAAGSTTLTAGSAAILNLDITLVPTRIRAGNAQADLAITEGPKILVPLAFGAPVPGEGR